jgi:hypothetical protein
VTFFDTQPAHIFCIPAYIKGSICLEKKKVFGWPARLKRAYFFTSLSLAS